MRIGILTHPLKSNYGGILQCYALTVCLKKMGHDPIVIRREYNKSFFLWEWIKTILRFMHFPRYYNPNAVDRTVNIRPFVDKYIVRTLPIRSQNQVKKVCKKYALEAVIVGSDQVWRADYAMNFGYNYFLDFVPDSVVKLSYAASFGLADWRYTKEQTCHIKDLLQKFRGLSVREKEGVDLCEKNLGITVVQLLDPTLLLSTEHYNKIASPRLLDEKYIFVYWLGDKSQMPTEILSSSKEDYQIVYLNLRDNKEQISIEDWLSYIKYSESVITDSYHGCIFSILFHKQFVLSKNVSGGICRLSSLFALLGIEDKFDGQLYEIDYGKIDEKLIKEREKVTSYLIKTLL